MGHVNVHILGILFNKPENRRVELKLSEDMTLEHLIHYLIKDHFRAEPDLDLYRTSDWKDYLLLLVNGKIAKPYYILQAGDKVTITPMFAGG